MKIILGGATRHSVDRSTVQKKSPAKVSETQRNKRYLQSGRETNKKTIFIFRWLNKMTTEQNNEISVLPACYVVSYDMFCHKTTRDVF